MSRTKDEWLERAFRENLRERMHAVGINQAQLAAMIDVSPSFISHLLTGHRGPGLPTLAKLADALECRPSDLISGAPDSPHRAPVLAAEFSGISSHQTA